MAEPLKARPEPEEEAWGLSVTGVDSVQTALAAPAAGWRLLYLVRGEARLTVPGRRGQRLEAGEVALLDSRPGCRLVPDPQRECRIHCVDFDGAWAERWCALGLFGAPPVVVRAGFDEGLLGGIVRLWELSRNPPAGAGLLMAGALADLLARLRVALRLGGGTARQRNLAQQARRLLDDPARDRFDLEAAAGELGVSYSWFRRSFRRQTGVPPHRYRHLQKLERACRLLSDTDQPIGEVAAALGFSSQAYFARMFRKETGFSPSVWRTLQVERR